MLYMISHGAVRFGGDTILEDINFEIRSTEKIAIVGRNGSGKTTLCRLIANEVELSKRSSDEDIFIATSGKPDIGYLKQISFEDEERTAEAEIEQVFAPIHEQRAKMERLTVEMEQEYSDQKMMEYTRALERYETLGGYTYRKERDTAFVKFGFAIEDMKRPIREFSGGQRTKIAFIKLLLRKPDILILDEPTNHLDIDAVEWLESYLKTYKKAVVIVSHDRMFLDQVCEVVYEIEYKTAKRYPGNYSYFIQRKRENYEKQQKDYQAQQKEIARLNQLIDRFKNKPTKVAMTRSKLKQIEHMVKIEPPQRYDTKSFHAMYNPIYKGGNDVLSIQELEIGYEFPLAKVSGEIKRGQRVGIIGGNGSGKSTFLRTLTGQLPALGGIYQYGHEIQVGYFEQQMAQYRSDKSVIDDFWDEFPALTQTEVRSALGAFLFTQDEVFKQINMLSGGEKVRLALAKIFQRRPNLLILDEPTNHMDLVGKETLESMLKDFQGTVVFVSHDRYFIRELADNLFLFEHDTVKLFPYGYQEYLEQRERGRDQGMKDQTKAANDAAAGTHSQIPAKIMSQDSAQEPEKDSKAAFLKAKETARNERRAQKLENEIEELEVELMDWELKLDDETIATHFEQLNEVQKKIRELKDDIDIRMEEWELLQAE